MSQKKGLSLFSITILVGLMIGSILFGPAPVRAADGSGTNSVSPTSTDAGSTGNTFTFTFTATEAMDSGGISITSPAGWSAMQGTNGSAGYTTVSTTGMVADVKDVADSATGWNAGSACSGTGGAPAADTAVFHEGAASIRCINGNESNNDQWYKSVSSQDWSAYTKVGFWIRTDVALTAGQLEFVYDNSAALASALEVILLPAVPANTWTYVTLNFGATTRTSIVSYGFRSTSNSAIDNKTIYIDDILMGPGAPTFASGVMSARMLSLANTQTVTTTYGSGGGASGVTVPTTAGTYTATTTSRFDDSGTLTNIASHPTIAVRNPIPTTTSISPNTKSVGDAQFTMTVNGTNFVPSSIVRLNGSDRATTYTSSTQLSATILASDITTATTTAQITVFNPTPGGGTSNAQTFTVNKRSTTIAVGSSALSSVYGSTVTFTATTTPSSGGPATGTVTFKNGGVTMGTGTLSGNVATYATSTLKAIGSPYSITAVYEGDGTFLGSTSAAISQTITAKALTVTGVTAATKTYDATTTATLSGGTLVGIVGSDVVSINARTGTFTNKNVGTGKPITVTSVTLTGADAANYTTTNPTDVTGTITARGLIVSASASNKTYDGTTNATVSLSDDRIVGDVFTATSTSATFDTKNVGIAKTVTVSGISISGTDSGNYSANATTTAAANIIARGITVTAATNTKEYDQTTNASSTPTITVGAIQVGDSAAFTESYDNKNVGTGKTLTPSGSVTDGNSGLNYDVTFVNNTTGVITAKGLTVTGMTGVNKVYDSFTTASVTGGSLSGVIGGDDVSLNNASTTASFANKNVGTAKTITVSGVALSGIDAGNYTVANPTGITANITAAGLTVSGLTAADRVYNATTTATVSAGSLVGILGSDVVTINTRAGVFADKHVGTNKPVTITAITLSGGDASNYTVTLPSGVTATITQFGLTVSGVTANDKDYDGNTTATLNVGGATLNTIFGGDDASLNSVSAVGVFDTAEVGENKLVTVSGLTVGGADGGNYLLAQPTTTATIRNPIPRVDSVTPNEAFVNASDTIITVSGLAFTPGTVIRFDDNNLATTFINGTTATATIPTAYLATVGTSTITAFSPTPGGGVSTTSASFLIKNHVPVITELSPNNAEEGSATTSLTISGSLFAANATVTFNGTPLAIDSQSSTAISTNIPASLLETFGTSVVAVTNPTPGGGTATSSFSITRGAVRFAFSGTPYSGTVDAPITVTIQARKENDSVATNYQSDVTLNVGGSASPSSVLVNIINGVGTTTIINTVAETVNLTLSDSQGTGLDVTATTTATFAHGAVSRFALTGQATLNVGDRAAFTVARKDQFNNPVTTGADTTAYFYTSSTSTSAVFYDAPTAGTGVTSVVMGVGTSTATVWYYDEDPGVYTITASDNGTAPNGTTGIDDATSTIAVNAVATKFVIIDPTDGTVDAPITVTVQAQDNLNRIVTDYQNDVTLIASSTSGQATTTGLVNIINGVGTINVSDTVAETVNLTLSDSQGTGLNVASSTQDVIFAPGAITQFSLTHVGNMEQNTRKEFVAGRKDQYGNYISASTTIGYLYASPSSTVKFYDAASGGGEISSITLTPGNATTSFWFYSNAPATTTVTVSDSATTPDGDTGVNDAANEILVTPIAVRFELVDPTNGTVDAPITVTVRALDEFGQIVPSFDEDVTIVVTGSAVANPTIVNIENGVGTTQLTDTVAETVNLSLTDSQSTGLIATSTQQVVFGVGAFAKLNLNNVTSATAGTLVPYTVTRTDQYNNQITSGSYTINLSATPTTTPGLFYNGNSTTSAEVTSIVINPGSALAEFWYYNEVAGSYQVTAQMGAVIGYDDIVIDPSTIAKFTMNDRTSMNPASRAQYTITRKDQFDNLVTAGDTIAYMYVSPTGSSTAFYDAATAGSVVTSITIGTGQATQNVWYYEEEAGTHTVTVSDNATAADGSIGIADAFDQISVQTATATRFVFNPSPSPQTASAGASSVVTIQAQDDYGNADTNYQSDVTLVTGVNSAFGTGLSAGQALIDIVNGEGTITLTDNVAEVVNLALSDSQGTELNVSAVSSITWIPGATTQFVLSDQTSMVAGSSTPYVVTRKDQFGNAVTSGSNLVYLYSNSTGAHKRFQSSEASTSSISFVTLSGSMASTTFWYYDEDAGTWDITTSDNATTPDGAAGIADASDSLIVTPAPVVADRYVILDPSDAGLNENAVVIIQARDADGALDTTIQEDVYLVFSTSSIQSSPMKIDGRALVSIVDGVGTVTVSDGVAETVQLSLERLSGSTSTLAITSTQDIMFFVRQTFVAGGGGGVFVEPTASFTGRAYPGAKISLFARVDGQDIPLERDIEVRADGTFTIEFSGALKGLESFGLAILDKDGKVAQVKTYDMNKVTKTTEAKNLYIAPTTGLVQRTVTIGNNVGVVGSAAPGSVIKAEVDGKPIEAEAAVGRDGSYRLLINTRDLAYGGHVVRTKQIDDNGVESDYSPLKVFMVSRALVTRADLNNNGGIDIGDWSIFLTRFGSTDAEARRQVDLNDDGKVDISDFSIFIRSTVNR